MWAGWGLCTRLLVSMHCSTSNSTSCIHALFYKQQHLTAGAKLSLPPTYAILTCQQNTDRKETQDESQLGCLVPWPAPTAIGLFNLILVWPTRGTHQRVKEPTSTETNSNSRSFRKKVGEEGERKVGDQLEALANRAPDTKSQGKLKIQQLSLDMLSYTTISNDGLVKE